MMGQNTSSHCSRKLSKSVSRTPSLKDSVYKKFGKTHTKNLSATFNIIDLDLQWDLLNVNGATEEELMTLPGVSRTIARNIVEYRQTIGGFKKVEDLALVSGVGAAKLEVFRSEITVNNRRKNAGGSYSSSIESLPNSEASVRTASRPSSTKIVNVNAANVFQLMTVRGMSQELAASIVDYREKKGPFKNLSELLKVKGITQTRLSSMKFYLSVEYVRPTGRLATCSSFTNGPRTTGLALSKLPHHKRSKSDPAFSSPIQTPDNLLQEVFNILSAHSTRPIIEDVFCGSRNGRSALRIGSWNLQEFTVDKGNNPGVREVICRTILENGINLIAIHEIVSWEALLNVVSELNAPKLSKVKSWEGSRGTWHVSKAKNFSLSESSSKYQSGFLYNSHDDFCLKDLCLTPLPSFGKSTDVNPSLMGWFQVNELNFLLSCVCLKETSETDDVPLVVVNTLKERYPGEDNTLVIVETSRPVAQKNVQRQNCSGYTELLSSSSSTQLNSRLHHTTVLLSGQLEKFYTGHSGVVREGLRHLAIPDGWSWGGTVSKSCPIWLELYTDREKVLLTNGLCNESSDSADTRTSENTPPTPTVTR